MASPPISPDSTDLLPGDEAPDNEEIKGDNSSDELKMSDKKSLGLHRPRFDVSLFYLTRKFMDFMKSAPDGIVDLNDAAKMLGVGKRRVYDITNVLDGIHLVEKKSKNLVQWIGDDLNHPGTKTSEQQRMRNDISDLTAMEEALDELIRDCAHQLFALTEDRTNRKFAYVTYQDIHSIDAYHEQLVIAVKAPEETKLEVPSPKEDCIEVHMKSQKGPIDVYLCEVEQNPQHTTFQQLTKILKMDPEPIVIDDDD